MAKDASNHISWFLKVSNKDKENLSELRLWENLKVAFENDKIWITNFEQQQIDSAIVKSIPFKAVYYLTDGKLYPQGSLLPECKQPALLWTPIERALPVSLPVFNHNYFGIEQSISIQIIPSEKEQEAKVMLVDLDRLHDYIISAPEIRLKNISWVVMGKNKALLLGTPFLPVNGEVFWKNYNSIIPVGYNFDMYILAGQLERVINPEGDCWMLWNKDSSYLKIKKSGFVPLTLSSFRLTIEKEKVK